MIPLNSVVLFTGQDGQAAIREVSGLVEVLQLLRTAYASLPATNSDAYEEAPKALKYREDLTFADGEIDAFLPRPLKRDAGKR